MFPAIAMNITRQPNDSTAPEAPEKGGGGKTMKW